jgi:hypothetical protein
MAVRLSALRARRPLLPLPPGIFLVLISAIVWVDCRAIVRLEGKEPLKKSSDLIGIRTRNLRLVAECLNQLRYRVPQEDETQYFLSGAPCSIKHFNRIQSCLFSGIRYKPRLHPPRGTGPTILWIKPCNASFYWRAIFFSSAHYFSWSQDCFKEGEISWICS